jgi:hypothetical protein
VTIATFPSSEDDMFDCGGQRGEIGLFEKSRKVQYLKQRSAASSASKNFSPKKVVGICSTAQTR